MGFRVFDATNAFAKRFTPMDGGYLFFPSRKGGGKFVSSDEFTSLSARWKRVSDRRTVIILVAVVILCSILIDVFALPKWTNFALSVAVAVTLLAWVLWESAASRRLVRGRPDIAPPRSASQARREARALLSWPFVTLGLLFFGVIFIATVSLAEWTLASIPWIAGTGFFFVCYVWIAIQKIRDARWRATTDNAAALD